MLIQYIILPLLCLALCSQTNYAQTVDIGAVDGHLHIKLVESSVLDLDGYTGGVLALDLLLVPYGTDTIYRPFKLPGHPLDKVYRVRFTMVELVDALLNALEALAFVEFAEKMPLGLPAFEPNDLSPQQWYLPHVNAQAAWDMERGDPDITIAVVDNAFAIDHEDLAANIFINEAEANGLPLIDDDLNGYADDVNGFDTADKNTDARPPSGQGNSTSWTHGTHVAGIAAAVTDNGVGVSGMAHGCGILPVKVAQNSGNGQQFETPMDGVFYASRTGADVINMSWGTYMNSQVMRLVMQEADDNDIILIAAAGNQDTDEPFYPAALPEVMSVGATDDQDRKATFSNFGSTIDVMAPGVGIYSVYHEDDNTYGNGSGTSMAAPLVSGLAALVRSRFPSLSAQEVKQRIKDGCVPIDHLNDGFGGMLGEGIINAHAALSVTGISDRNAARVVSLYPNPAAPSQQLKIIGQGSDPLLVSVFDITGRCVLHGQYHDDGIKLPSDLTSGIYAVRIQYRSSEQTLKLVVR